MAKVGLKSQLYQQQKKHFTSPPQVPSLSTIYRPQNHLTVKPSPLHSIHVPNSLLMGTNLLQSSREPQQSIFTPAPNPIRPPYLSGNTLDPMSYLHHLHNQQQQQQHHQQQRHQTNPRSHEAY